MVFVILFICFIFAHSISFCIVIFIVQEYMKTKKVYIWVKKDGDSSFKLFRNEDHLANEIAHHFEGRKPSKECSEPLVLQSSSSILFSSEIADCFEDVPVQSVYGVTKPTASGIVSMKQFRLSNANGKPLALNAGCYAISLDYKKMTLTIKSITDESWAETNHLVKTQDDSLQLLRKIYAIIQSELDFDYYWQRREKMRGIYNRYEKRYDESDGIDSFCPLDSKDSKAFNLDSDHCFKDEIMYFQKLLGKENKYSRWFTGQPCELDDPFEHFAMCFWRDIKLTTFSYSDAALQEMSENPMEFLKVLEGMAEKTCSAPECDDMLRRVLELMSVREDIISDNNANRSDIIKRACRAFNSFNKQTRAYEIDKESMECVFMVLNSPILKPTAEYEIIRLIKSSSAAAKYQKEYNDFRKKNLEFFEVLDLCFSDLAETCTELSEQDMCCDYGAFRKTYHFILSIDQLNQLYSKLQDAGRLGTETDIRDLASNLTGKYDGKRQSKAVDWKGNKTDLAILIGLLMDKCCSRDTWSCSERLFTINGEDIEWQTLNVLYNRHKNQPSRTPKKVMRIMDEIFGNDPASQSCSGGNTMGE